MIAIKQESVQAIRVTVRDTTGLVSDLSTAKPVFQIWSVDPATDANVSEVVTGQEAIATGLNVECTIFGKYKFDPAGITGWGIANNPPSLSLPLVVATGVNDRFNFQNILLGENVVPAGTYSTYDAVATAMSLALSQFSSGYGSYYYDVQDDLGAFTFDANVGKFRFDGKAGWFSNGTDPAYNGLLITNGGARDMLAGTGWTDGQVVFDHAVSASDHNSPYPSSINPTPLAVGRYRLYISFESLHAQVPKLGPVEFFIY